MARNEVLTAAAPGRVLAILSDPLGHGLIKLRNTEALRRLKELAEGDAPRPTGDLPPRTAG